MKKLTLVMVGIIGLTLSAISLTDIQNLKDAQKLVIASVEGPGNIIPGMQAAMPIDDIIVINPAGTIKKVSLTLITELKSAGVNLASVDDVKAAAESLGLSDAQKNADKMAQLQSKLNARMANMPKMDDSTTAGLPANLPPEALAQMKKQMASMPSMANMPSMTGAKIGGSDSNAQEDDIVAAHNDGIKQTLNLYKSGFAGTNNDSQFAVDTRTLAKRINTEDIRRGNSKKEVTEFYSIIDKLGADSFIKFKLQETASGKNMFLALEASLFDKDGKLLKKATSKSDNIHFEANAADYIRALKDAVPSVCKSMVSQLTR